MALEEAELLKEFNAYDFNQFICLIRDYFDGHINGGSKMVKEIKRLDEEFPLNQSRLNLFYLLHFISESIVNEKEKQLISVEGIDEIIICLQKKKELIHKEYLKAKMVLLKI